MVLILLFFPFRIHYVEYLCGLVIKDKLEVVSLMELGEVQAVFTRAGKFIPRQRPGEYEFKYLKRLAQVEKIMFWNIP